MVIVMTVPLANDPLADDPAGALEMTSQTERDTHGTDDANAFAAFRVTRGGVDPRADGARRTVHVGATLITIERVLDGVKMRIGVPVAAYRDLVVAVRLPAGRAALVLRHDDPELDVTLATGEATAMALAAKDWALVLGRPIAVERACVSMAEAIARRRKRGKPAHAARRSSFARRRGTGRAERSATSFAHEHEIIARD